MDGRTDGRRDRWMIGSGSVVEINYTMSSLKIQAVPCLSLSAMVLTPKWRLSYAIESDLTYFSRLAKLGP